MRAVMFNELDHARSQGRQLVLAKPAQVVSPAYIAERNARDFSLLRALEEAKAQHAP